MPSFCVVSNCEFKYSHSENVSFHKFPHQSRELLAKWIEFTDRGINWKPSKWSAICSRHFLPSDFRDFTSRKCLRRNAVPSVTMKQFIGNFLDNHSDKTGDSQTSEGLLQPICRFCGLSKKPASTFSTNFEVFAMIQKCFPTLNIQQNDTLPKAMCLPCLQRLQSFSEFVDTVLRTQKDLVEKSCNECPKTQQLNAEKTLKIKQEPVIRVKQEISDSFHNLLSEEFDPGLDDERMLEQKSQLSEFPLINPQEIINNCDIMEVVSLEDAFIDIPDDENADDPSSETKVNFQQTYIDPAVEHNYAKEFTDEPNLDVNSYKTVKHEEPEVPIVESINKSNKDIIVIDDSIVKPVPAFDLYKCNDCPLQFLNKIILEEHQKLHQTISAPTCDICNINFPSVYELLRHKNHTHKKLNNNLIRRNIPRPCSMCGRIFANKLALNNHSKYICNYQRERNYECKFCSIKLKKWILLRRHERVCASNTRKKRTRISKTIADTIQLDSNNLYTCQYCNRSYTRRHNLFRHQRTHRPKENWNFKCGDCEGFFDRLADLKRHLTKNQCNETKFTKNIFYVCTICGKQLKSYQRLKTHKTIHSSKKPYVCETCGKAFRCFNNLYQHKITHTDTKPYSCDQCVKSFKRKGGLNQHKRAFHLKLKPHECPVCKHKYALKGDMTRCKHSDLQSKTLTFLRDLLS